MAVQFVNNAGLLSQAFDQLSRMNEGKAQALGTWSGALDKTVKAGVKGYQSGQIAKALGAEGTDYQAAAKRAMELGDVDTAMRYADLYDKSLDRQAQTAYKNLLLDEQKAKAAIEAAEKAEAERKKKEQEQKSLNILNESIATLERLAGEDNLTYWDRTRAAVGLGSSKTRKAQGELAAAIAGIAPIAIQRLKEAGVSGINTQGEFFNYIGLPPDATNEQIAGALPNIKKIVGYEGGAIQQPSANKTVSIGQVVNGYKYVGGDPNNPASWSKI